MKLKPLWGRLGIAVVLAVGLTAFASASASADSPSQTGQHILNGTKPAWTVAVPNKGAVAANTPEGAKVWLASRPGLAAAARAVSTPKSSSYRQYLTADQVRAQYAPTSDQVAAVSSWLAGAGLKIDQVGADNFYIQVSGPASAMNKAFSTTLSQYQIQGNLQQAPSSDLAIPASLQASVLGITGLTTFGHVVHPDDLGNPAGFVNSPECGNYYGALSSSDEGLPKFQGHQLPYSICGYTPPQVRTAYGQNDSEWGYGQGVAITDAFDSSHLASDANQYADNNDSGNDFSSNGSFTDESVVEGSNPNHPTSEADCGGNGWYGEQTLDVEAIHGMAPDANIKYYGAADCYDDSFLAQFANIVTNDDASIVSDSWGEPSYVMINNVRFPTLDATLIQEYEDVLQSAALEGIGFYFSSGDNGDELAATGWKSPDYPTEDPWVTSVGGTSLAVDSSGNRIFESGWGTEKYSLECVSHCTSVPASKPKIKKSTAGWVLTVPFQYGAGGGYADPLFAGTTYLNQAQAWYQVGLVNSPTGGRAVPDIAADADPTTGYLIGMTQDFSNTENDIATPKCNVPSGTGSGGVYCEFREGGTSLASPLIAGVQADVQSDLDDVCSCPGSMGFVNPMLYLLPKSAFYDVRKTFDLGNVREDYHNQSGADEFDPAGGFLESIRTFNQDSSLTTGKGWDDVTGLGTPNGDNYTEAIFNYFFCC